MRRNALAFPGGGVSFTRRPRSARKRFTRRPTCWSFTFPVLPTSFLSNNAIDEQIVDASAAKDAVWTAVACSGLAAEVAAGFVASVGCVVPQAVASAVATADMAANRFMLTSIGLGTAWLDRAARVVTHRRTRSSHLLFARACSRVRLCATSWGVTRT